MFKVTQQEDNGIKVPELKVKSKANLVPDLFSPLLRKVDAINKGLLGKCLDTWTQISM